MTTVEREAVATRAGLNKVAVKNLARRGWQGLDRAQQQNLRKGFERPTPQTQGGSPSDFIPAPDGGLDYGEITPAMAKEMRRQAGKIRLQRGDERFGLAHIEQRHGAEIRSAGFQSVEAFVADIAGSIAQVWQPGATSQLVALKMSGNDRIMYVQLQAGTDGGVDFYTVNTAFPARSGYVRNKKDWKKLWEDRAQPSQPATSEQAPFAASPQVAGEATTIPSGQSRDSVPQPAQGAQADAGPTLQELEQQLFVAKNELENQGQVQNARTAERVRQLEAAIEERINPALFKALDGVAAYAKRVRLALDFKSKDESIEAATKRALKSAGVVEPYLTQMTQAAVKAVKGGQAQESVPGLFDGKPDARNSAPMQELDGFKVGEAVTVQGRTFGPGEIEVLFTREMAGFGPTPMARVTRADGKKLDVLTSELRAAKAMDGNGKESAAAQPEKTRVPYPSKIPGMTSDEDVAAQRKVVDFMNGDITRDALMDYLEKSGLPEGKIWAFTQRLQDDGPSIGEVNAMMERRKSASNAQQDELPDDMRATEAGLNANTRAADRNRVAQAQADALREREKAAKAKMLNAAAKLADLLSKNTRMNITPEQEQAMLPIAIELFEGAMELGYVKFKQAAKYVRQFIANAIDQEAADALPVDTLQGAYIAVSRRHKDKAITPKAEVITVDSVEDIDAEVLVAPENVVQNSNETEPSNERSTVRIESQEALDGVATQEGGRAEGDRPVGVRAERDGARGTGAAAGADGTGVQAPRSGRGGDARVRSAATRGAGRGRLGAQGAGRAGGAVPQDDAGAARPGSTDQSGVILP